MVTNLEIMAELTQLAGGGKAAEVVAIGDDRLQRVLHRAGEVDPGLFLEGALLMPGTITLVFSRTTFPELGLNIVFSNECAVRTYSAHDFDRFFAEAMALKRTSKPDGSMDRLASFLQDTQNT